MFVDPAILEAAKDVPLLMGIGPIVGALLAGAGGTLAGGLLGGLMGGGRSGGGGGAVAAPNPQLDRLAGVEGDLLERKRDVFDELLAIAQGFEPSPVGRLNVADSPFLDEDFLAQLTARPDLDILSQLLNVGGGTGATQQAAALAQQQSLFNQQQSAQRNSAIGGSIGDIISAIILGRGRGSQPLVDTGNPASTVLVPDSFTVD